ncbi:hypothetical protein [Streptomyces sp. NPDC046805]|uniref:hypothetical protein n=1 Tax=Streptomyces sp. NPDC046805 TaxID=3155134 RepID=UPI003401166B
MNMTRRLMIFGTVTAAAAGLLTVGAPPASADSHYGCTYPRVCFYLTDADFLNDHPTAAYQDVTSYYQNLGSTSRGANWVLNTRNDDRAYIRYVENGQVKYLCVTPDDGSGGSIVEFGPSETVTGIRIDWAPTCP